MRSLQYNFFLILFKIAMRISAAFYSITDVGISIDVYISAYIFDISM